LTRPDAFMGTPRYMAPEALCGQQVDCRVDVYALGCVAYFMLCGEPPFSSGDAYLDIYRQIHDPPPPIDSRRDRTLPKPSPEFLAVILRCLEKEKGRRFSNAAELLMELEQTPEHGKWRPAPAAPSLDDQAELAPTDPQPRPAISKIPSDVGRPSSPGPE
jgi:serine/threonine-protein kinase